MVDLDRHMSEYQTEWRCKSLDNQVSGVQNGKQRPWILPKEAWELGLWPPIRSSGQHSLPDYLERNDIQKHNGVHNLKSSWMLCANLYFPFQRDLPMIAGFLREHINCSIESVAEIELEYEEATLPPWKVLGEPRGQRGKNQTSPDTAFICVLSDGLKALLLVESKFTEHSFYECSGRKRSTDPCLCLDFSRLVTNPEQYCYMTRWQERTRANRRYWEYIRFSNWGLKSLSRCPASIAGSQLFRQQALAEAIAKTEGSLYEEVVSCVAYDARNDTLVRSMRGAGIKDFTNGWGPMFEGKASFAAFTHQQWVAWVQKHDADGRHRDWLEYVCSRYSF